MPVLEYFLRYNIQKPTTLFKRDSDMGIWVVGTTNQLFMKGS